MPPEAYRELISATNMKQRVRKLIEYTWADRLGYAVIGTPNLLEYDQGFFVKGGDGLADVKPIARLYKSQVYLLARELGLPEAIATRAPTTETFSMPQTQEEFYFGHPYERMDLLIWGHAQGVEPAELVSSRRARARGGGDRLPGDRASPRRDRVPPRSADHPRPRRLSMCGIAGIVRPRRLAAAVDEEALLRMAAAIRHRGPDGFGLALDAGAGLVSARLAIFDLPRGWQPLEAGPEGSILVYNGEVYNHPELRAELERARRELRRRPATPRSFCACSSATASPRSTGSTASSRSPGGSPQQRRLTLVRDRFGVRPLHYALLDDGSLVFGSEAKALFASGEVAAAPDLAGIDEVFTLWGPRAPRTAFRGVSQVGRAG